MSTVDATEPLFGHRELLRWARGPHSTAASRGEQAYRERLLALAPGGDEITELAFDLDDVTGGLGLWMEDRAMLIVGTICLRRGELDLWREIYRTVHEDPDRGTQALAWLAERTAAARRGEL